MIEAHELNETIARRKAYFEDPVLFVVKGRGVFPADMLRHDRCYPVDGDINMVTDPRIAKRPLVTVVLVAPKRSAITTGRWKSFGWTVTEIGGEGVL